MKLDPRPAPHIRMAGSTRGIMWDCVFALSFLYAMATYYYGPRALVLGLVGALCCFISDRLCCVAMGRRPNRRDVSAVVTGLILPLMMPASIPYFVVVIACGFAIIVAKAPFGGTGHNVFNPAAAGFSFVAFLFGPMLFTYPPPAMQLPVWGAIEFTAPVSPAFRMMVGGTPGYDFLDMVLGNYSGPMGGTNILILLACLLYLVFRGTIRWATPLSFFSAVALLAFLFPRGRDVTGLESVWFELATGLVLFGGIFLLGDPVTTPVRRPAKIAFGFTAGIVVMLFRHFGSMEEQITYALLLMNAAMWGFERAGEKLTAKVRRKRHEADAKTKRNKALP